MPVIMLEKEESKESKIRNSVNKLIADSEEQTAQLNTLIMEAPDVLLGYQVFREILRAVKRGDTLENASKKSGHKSCPPGVHSGPDCDFIKCDQCWREFCENYLEKISKKG